VKNDLKLMSIGFFLDDNQPVMWRGPMLHRALEQFLSDVHWGELDVLVVDMPPGRATSRSRSASCCRGRGDRRDDAAARRAGGAARAALMAQKTSMRLVGVVENMSGDVFGQGGGERLADELDVPLLGRIPLDPRLREAGDAGEPLVTPEIAAIAERVVELRPGGFVKQLNVVG
jgi:ATP-binding protein involved in chromosome partitioning